MRIQTATIENFKQFERLDVDLRPVNCLVGPNNSGKTTLLQALALFDFCVHHTMHRKNGDWELRNRTIAPEDFFILPVSDPLDIWHERRAMAGSKQRRVRVSVRFDNGVQATATVKLDFNRYGVAVEVSDPTQDTLAHLRELRIAYLPVFSMFLPREERRLKGAIEDELGRGRVNGVIRNLLLELKTQKRLDELVGIMRRSFPSLSGLQITFDEATDRYISVTYQEQGKPKEFDLFSAGSGFQQFIYLFGFVLLRQPTIVLLDEPDVHLHGSLQHVLLEELRALAGRGRQVLFATHSRELITRVAIEDVLSLQNHEVRHLRVQFDVYDILDKLGSLDPTQLSVVQAYRRVIVVEDASDRELIETFAPKVLGNDVWQQCERRLAFCYSKGNPWKQHDTTRLQSILQQVVGAGVEPLRLFVVADRDYYPEVTALEAVLVRPNVEFHIWRRTEIENYLLDLAPLTRVVNPDCLAPTFPQLAFEDEFRRLLDASRDAADDGLVSGFEELRRRNQEKWDASTLNRKAREYLGAHWEAHRIGLADAKEVVLPGLKRWLQSNGFGQFSNSRLAETFAPEEVAPEFRDLLKRLAKFAGVAVSGAA